MALGKYNEAVEVYDQAIKVNPHFAGAHYSKGVVLDNHLGNYKGAIEAYNKAIDI